MNNDLISREALLNSFDVRKVVEYDETGCGMVYLAVPVEAIKTAPAVDAEPVRHGRWVDDRMEWRCTNCDTSFRDDIEFIRSPIFSMPNYCPECGAKMDLEAQHE